MEITESLSEGLRREYTVVVPHADVDRKVVAELERLATKADVPGFRRGKLPLAVARQRWSGDVHPAIMEEIARDAVAQTVDRHGLTPLDTPSVEIVNPGKREDFECKVVLDIFPEIPPLDLGEIELEMPVPVLDDDELGTLLGNVARDKAEYHEVDGLAARDGDKVYMELVEPDADEDREPRVLTATLGDERSRAPHLLRQLLGAKAGDAISLDRRAPDDPVGEGGDDDDIIEVRVTKVCEPHVLEVGDELARSLDLPDLAALRDKVREEAGLAHAKMSRHLAKRRLFDQLAERVEFQLPQELVDREFSQLWKRVEAAMRDGSLDADDAGKPEDQLREEYRAIARRRVALALLMMHIARTSGIEVTDEEIARHAPALTQGLMPEVSPDLLRQLLANPEQREGLRRTLLEEKVTEYLFARVKMTERPVTMDALGKEAVDAG